MDKFKIMSWNINRFRGMKSPGPRGIYYETEDERDEGFIKNMPEIINQIHEFFEKDENGIVILQEVDPQLSYFAKFKKDVAEFKEAVEADGNTIILPAFCENYEKGVRFSYYDEEQKKTCYSSLKTLTMAIVKGDCWEPVTRDESFFNNHEYQRNRIVEIKNKDVKSLRIIGLHRDTSKLWDFLIKYIEENKENFKFIIVGDFNDDKGSGDFIDKLLKENKENKEGGFIDLVPEYIVTYITRYKTSRGTHIVKKTDDHILLKPDGMKGELETVEKTEYSDHCIITAEINLDE